MHCRAEYLYVVFYFAVQLITSKAKTCTYERTVDRKGDQGLWRGYKVVDDIAGCEQFCSESGGCVAAEIELVNRGCYLYQTLPTLSPGPGITFLKQTCVEETTTVPPTTTSTTEPTSTTTTTAEPTTTTAEPTTTTLTTTPEPTTTTFTTTPESTTSTTTSTTPDPTTTSTTTPTPTTTTTTPTSSTSTPETTHSSTTTPPVTTTFITTTSTEGSTAASTSSTSSVTTIEPTLPTVCPRNDDHDSSLDMASVGVIAAAVTSGTFVIAFFLTLIIIIICGARRRKRHPSRDDTERSSSGIFSYTSSKPPPVVTTDYIIYRGPNSISVSKENISIKQMPSPRSDHRHQRVKPISKLDYSDYKIYRGQSPKPNSPTFVHTHAWNTASESTTF